MKNKKSKEFLMDLLSTPSPSGYECTIQKKWLAYVSSFADDIQTDVSGNAIGVLNGDAEFTILLAGHCDEIGFMIHRIDEKGFLYFQNVGGISPNIAPGMKVDILGYAETITGIVGVNAQHHGGLKEKISFEDLYIDCGAKSKEEVEKYVRLGDYAVYKREPEWLLNQRLSGRGLDNRTGAFIVAEVLRRLSKKKLNVGVYAVSTVGEEIGLHGAYFAGAGLQPDMAIACDVTFATDYPGVNTSKYGDFFLDQGPVLARGPLINNKVNELLERSAKKLKIPLQYELLSSSTGTDADRLRFTGQGLPIALVSLPLRYMHAPVETISLVDIEQEIQLMTHMIGQLKGPVDLRPVVW